MNEQVTNMIKLKFIRNRSTPKIANNTPETMTFDKTEMIQILDLRSLGYYKIKQDVLQKNLGNIINLNQLRMYATNSIDS